MKKNIMIVIAGLLLISLNVFAQDDVSIDSEGNVTTGVTNPDGNLEVIGASGEDAIVGSTSGTGAAGVYGERFDNNNYGILGYDNSGVYGYSISGYAGYFQGDARVTGNMIIDGALISGESDPTVPAYIKDGIDWLEVTNRPLGLDDGDDVGITSESDPTVISSVKDGVDWSELSGIPAGFADGIDNTSNGFWIQNGYSIYYDTGFVGAGTSNPLYALHGVNPLPNDDDPAVYGEHAKTDYYGIGVKGVGLWKGVEGVVNATGVMNYFGIVGSAYTTGSGGTTYGVRGSANGGTENYGVYGSTTDSGNSYGVYGTNQNGTYGYIAGPAAAVYGLGVGALPAGLFEGDVTVNGTNSVQILRITGGADLSEQFNIKSLANNVLPEPGMIVRIDADRPGQLVVSTTSYDRRVAGIISGAGGVNPGMMMGQKGSRADGDTPVALSGRVYAMADTSNGPIKPGDLLTTSEIPGHAMRVTDYSKAQGAILGKAMSSLTNGRGLILVLVTLQ